MSDDLKQSQEEQPSQQQSVGNIQVEGQDHTLNVVQGQFVTLNQTKIVQHISVDERKAALEALLAQCTVKLNIPTCDELGTGFFVARGKILTCAHGVKGLGDKPVLVSWSEEKPIEAVVSGLLLDVDLALLEFDADGLHHPCVYLEQNVQVGDELYLYGYPHGLAQGVSAVGTCEGRSQEKPSTLKVKIGQSHPNLSGAPLLNRRTSKVCGIVRRSSDSGRALECISSETILTRLSNLKEAQVKFHETNHRWENLLPLVRCKPLTVIFASLVMTGLIILVRGFQVFQPFELNFYDSLMRARLNPPKQDDRIFVIKITQEDVDAAKSRGEILNDASISNETLARLLQKLTSLEPIAIGLDIYREQSLDLTRPENQELKESFQNPALFGVCKAGGGSYNKVPPPPEITPAQIGFSDFTADHARHIRRQLLAFYNSDSEGSHSTSEPPGCVSNKSFSLVLAEHYLKHLAGIETSVNVSENGCQIGFSNGIVLPNLQANTGGYQGYDSERSARFDGCQLLLSYRSQQADQAYETATLEEFLQGNFSLKDQIVLIGIDRTDGWGDNWTTPFNLNDEMTPGVLIQANMVSHLLDVAQTKSALIRVLPGGLDQFLILTCAVAGGVVGWWALSPRQLGIIILVSCTGAFVISFTAFQVNYWIPLMPHLLALSGASSYVWWSNLRLKLGANTK
jgi:CHASE2 domain-containing sensor protein